MRYKVFHTTATVVCLAALFGLLYLIWDASANDQWFFWLIVGVGILYAFGLFLLNKIFTF
jgi:fatty acid desaturase